MVIRAGGQMLLTPWLTGGGSEGPEEVDKRAAAEMAQRETGGSKRQAREEAGGTGRAGTPVRKPPRGTALLSQCQ